jgi:very-short-patch-repair endonuclease
MNMSERSPIAYRIPELARQLGSSEVAPCRTLEGSEIPLLRSRLTGRLQSRGNRRVLRERARYLRRHLTKAERELWQLVRRRQFGGVKFRRQAPVEGTIADFFAPDLLLVVEVDGAAHRANDARAARQRAWDRARDAKLRRLGYDVIRFTNAEVLNGRFALAKRLLTAIGQRRRDLER